MKLSRALVIAAFLLLSAPARGQVAVTGRFSSSVYSWEKFDTVGSSRKLLRGYQNVFLTASSGDLSFQTSLQGASLLSGDFGDEAQVRVSSAFLRLGRIAGSSAAEARLGRIPVFAGVGNGTVDGLSLRLGSGSRFSLVGYAGAAVAPDLHSSGFDNLDKNYFGGAQLIASLVDGSRLGLSYMNRRRTTDSYNAIRPDSLFSPALVAVTPEARAEQLAGADFSYGSGRLSTLYGRYAYDLNAKRDDRLELFGRFSLLPDRLSLTAGYIYRQPRVFQSSFFAAFPAESNKEYEGGIEYLLCGGSLSAFGRLAYVQYQGDQSRRLTAGLNGKYGSVRYSGANGYAGELNSFSLQAMCPLWEYALTPTAGFSFSRYRLPGGSLDDVFSAALGAVARPVRDVSVDAQLQWLRNKVARDDYRVLGKINYWFSYASSRRSGE